MARCAWIIDEDHLAEGPPGTYMNAKGIFGPDDAPIGPLEALWAGEGRQFKIYDDDGVLYYEGRIIVQFESDEGTLQDEHFKPLWDFGAPNAGATEIYYQVEGDWVEL